MFKHQVTQQPENNTNLSDHKNNMRITTIKQDDDIFRNLHKIDFLRDHSTFSETYIKPDGLFFDLPWTSSNPITQNMYTLCRIRPPILSHWTVTRQLHSLSFLFDEAESHNIINFINQIADNVVSTYPEFTKLGGHQKEISYTRTMNAVSIIVKVE